VEHVQHGLPVGQIDGAAIRILPGHGALWTAQNLDLIHVEKGAGQGHRAGDVDSVLHECDAGNGAVAELESLDNGKTFATARFGEVPAAAEQFRFYAGFANKIGGTTIPSSITMQPPAKRIIAYTVREPIGVVGAITPWNSPLLMAAMKLAPALACGCTVVLKPAEDTSLTALWLGRLLMEAGLPAGVVNIVTGLGATAGQALAEHPGVDKLTFTGSTNTGRAIIDAARGNLKKLTLELGGKSPAIVLDDADLDLAVPPSPAAFSTTRARSASPVRAYTWPDRFTTVSRNSWPIIAAPSSSGMASTPKAGWAHWSAAARPTGSPAIWHRARPKARVSFLAASRSGRTAAS
jgi:hypothetical protein